MTNSSQTHHKLIANEALIFLGKIVFLIFGLFLLVDYASFCLVVPKATRVGFAVYHGTLLPEHVKHIACLDSLNCVAIGMDNVDTLDYNSYIIKTTDGGYTWSFLFAPEKRKYTEFYEISYPTKGQIYIGSDYGVWIITDDGELIDTIRPWFVSKEKGELYSWIRRLKMCDSMNGIASGDAPLYVTNDGWRTWREIKHPWYSVEEALYCFDSLNFLVSFYVRRNGARVNGLARTTDGGKTWYEFPFVDDSGRYIEQYIVSAYFFDKLTGIAVGGRPTGIGNSSNSVILRTTDGGFTWRKVLDKETDPNFGLRNVAFNKYNSIGFAFGAWGIIFRSYNRGLDWTPFLFPNTNAQVKEPVYQTGTYAGRRLLVGTFSYGLWVWDWDQYPNYIDERSGENASRVFAYPNPFSESVTIQLNADVKEPIEMEFYDSMGNLIETQKIEYPEREAVFTPNDRSEGVYFYRIKTGEGTFSGSILKIK